MSDPVAPLFTPFHLANLELRNRIVMAPMTMQMCPGGIPGDEAVEHYGSRAAGGVGLIITEVGNIDHPAAAGLDHQPDYFGSAAAEGWKRVLAEVHGHGAKMFAQMYHAGSSRQVQANPDSTEVDAVSPSGLHLADMSGGRPMTKQDITDVISSFARAAKFAKHTGFDGIEIHGAHGYLIGQFQYAATNKRKDEYGGSIQNRNRFAVEVVRAVRAAVGPPYPICMRFSQWMQQDFNARLAETPEELAEFLLPMSEAGVDIFHGSVRRFWLPEFEGSDLNLAGWMKKITGKPTITVGSVGLDSPIFEVDEEQHHINHFTHLSKPASLDQVLEKLAAGDFDLVAAGRILLANPDWANKVKDGRYDEIKPYEILAVHADYEAERDANRIAE